MKITRATAEALAFWLDGQDGEVVEVALTTNGATGKVDVKATVVVLVEETVVGSSFEFEQRFGELEGAFS